MRANGLSRGEWIALAAAIVIAHLFYWRIVIYPSDFDARNYLQIAEDINRNGLFSKFYYSDIRTYAYPLFLAALLRMAGFAHIPVGLLIFETQLALFLLAAYVLRQRIAAIWPSFARFAFIGILLNIVALSYTPESLTESVSLSLILFAVAFYVGLLLRTSAWSVFLGSLAIGSAVMVRPANLFALVAWVIGAGTVYAMRRPRASMLGVMGVVLIVGMALPMVPQYVNNVRYYGEHTPLVAVHLGRNQQIWGIGNIKYATAMPPVPNPSIFYENPFANAGPVDEEQPLAWYMQHPLAGAITIALHTFNMLDQDLLFTYSRDLDPWYRIPLGIATHAMVGFALLGIAVLVYRARRDNGYALPAIALCAFVVAHVALHATATVEMRFGLPLLVLAGPLAIAAVRELARARRRIQILAAVGVFGYTVAALALSDWVRQQAPSIRAWQAAHTGSSTR